MYFIIIVFFFQNIFILDSYYTTGISVANYLKLSNVHKSFCSFMYNACTDSAYKRFLILFLIDILGMKNLWVELDYNMAFPVRLSSTLSMNTDQTADDTGSLRD